MWRLIILVALIELNSAADDDPIKINFSIKRFDKHEILTESPIRVASGTALTVICHLINTRNGTFVEESSLIWGKLHDYSKIEAGYVGNRLIWRSSTLSNKFVNGNRLEFGSIKAEDSGTYYCVSEEYETEAPIEISVTDNIDDLRFAGRFSCLDGHIIPTRYECDGFPDCPDGSDESIDLCNGDPCEGKFVCHDRCIPHIFCCDKRFDPNCLVTNRPSCCPPLDDPYDPLLYHGNQSNNPTVLSTFVLAFLTTMVALTVFVYFLVLKHRRQKIKNFQIFHRNVALMSCTHTSCRMHRYFVPNATVCFYNTPVHDNIDNETEPEVDFGLLSVHTSDSDRPPAYSDVVTVAGLMQSLPPPYEQVVN